MKVKVEDLIAAIEAKVAESKAELAKMEAKDNKEFEAWKPKALAAAKKHVAVLSKKNLTYEEAVESIQQVGGYWSHPPHDGSWARGKHENIVKRADADIKLLKMAAEATINVGVTSQFNQYL